MSSAMSMPPLRTFDAFPKTQPTYTIRSKRGGIATVVVIFTLVLLVFHEIGEWLYGHNEYQFSVDTTTQREMQLNVDLTVAMPCHYLNVDIRDAVGDRLKLSDRIQKDGTTFEPEKYHQMGHEKQSTLSRIVKDSRKGRKWFRPTGTRNRFKKTKKPIKNGPACRLYGSVETKKVNGNMHITTLGHGYSSLEHTDHKLMNLSHTIDEFSFGQHFPYIAQPLDRSVEISNNHFPVYQYFMHVVPTTYVDASGHSLSTNQYSAREDIKTISNHQRGIPGLFFRYDLEPIHLQMNATTMSFTKLLIRLTALIGGVWCCSRFAVRTLDRLLPKRFKPHSDKDGEMHIPITSPNVNMPSPRLSPGFFGMNTSTSPPPPYTTNNGMLSPGVSSSNQGPFRF
ncbi:hypothetical protein E3P86_03230 [Wallemia ichthyophaga]|uniref:ER-derived vesicles protein ERV41 n=1 Tax=Wallemia ichthyophaga TaxID=245174 RepID=A0A4T0ITW5_WALIC|nr:hypothetical protein E3P86_03230 [Wallemia ichthyophaga]